MRMYNLMYTLQNTNSFTCIVHSVAVSVQNANAREIISFTCGFGAHGVVCMAILLVTKLCDFRHLCRCVGLLQILL